MRRKCDPKTRSELVAVGKVGRAYGGMYMDQNLIICNIEPNHMWASIAIQKPDTDEGVNLSVEFLMQYLKDKGVKVGINRAALEALSYYVQYDKEIVVASGKYPVAGEDGHYEYAVPLEDKKAKPVVAEDGSVDYLNSLEISMVEEGQVFATYIPPTEGEYGYTVFSEMLKPSPGRHIPMLKGKGFEISEDGNEYIAKLSGRIFTENERVMIEPIYIVKGDLGIEHGNIRFNGDVEVTGDVHSGIQIDAEGSIFIHGHVGNCKLRAGGTVTIGKGIQGKYGCEIDAEGDVACNFVERCTIRSGAKVYANSLLDSRVFARDSVFVTSKHGCIIGGSVSAMQTIEAKDLGNDAGISTHLMIGELEIYRKALIEMKQRMRKVEKDIAVCEEQMKKCEQLESGTKSLQAEQVKMQVVRAKVVRQSEQKELMGQIQSLEEELARARMESHVKVTGIVYPGTVISSSKATYAQYEACKDVIFRPWLDQIQVMSPEEYGKINIT